MASATEVTEQLWKCYQQTIGRTGREGVYYRWAHDALSWWITTGRASRPWEDAFCRANPYKLMRYAAKRSGSHDICIRDVTKYLQRYCGLEKEKRNAKI